MISADEKQKLEHGFTEAEASLRLEGLTLTENFYSVKERILAGDISFEQGEEEILAHHRAKNVAVA
jgi:hypothetical protein